MLLNQERLLQCAQGVQRLVILQISQQYLMNHLDLIRNYINAYNAYDVAGMTANLHNDIVFEHITNGEVVLSLEGLEAFRRQAEQAVRFFNQRKQSITSITEAADRVEVAVAYTAIAAMDLPNGLKAGDAIELEGQSIFRFAGDKVIRITDIG
ncbi:Ketosteroid isomerase-related protein [Cnuella takakiae]|uniref:Ketosteroid isomerase-related protein n=2 Tax=Cnuella takakiae TaxID=1302690 RepID=A0A1M5E0W9_9BACT|nr:Ketosteroid isomerase-related protein [Cnuella takakiae]